MAMALDEPKENEKTFHIDGVDILIDEQAIPFLDGWTIESDREGFIFTMSVEAWCRLNDYTD